MKRFFSACLLLLVAIPLALPARAASTNDFVSTIQTLTTIKNLIEEVDQLQLQLDQIRGYEPLGSLGNAELRVGDSGPQVELLQKHLLRFQGVYPEALVTGYFGPLTEAALKRLQARYVFSMAVNGSLDQATIRFLNTRAEEYRKLVAASPEGVSVSFESSLGHSIQEAINRERAKVGAAALVWSSSLAEVALKHSQDQRSENQLATNPERFCQYTFIRHEGRAGFTARERVVNAGIQASAVGENILMLSPYSERRYEAAVGFTPPECPAAPKLSVASPKDFSVYFASIANFLQAVPEVRGVHFITNERMSESEIVNEVVESWLASPEHRAGMLNPLYTKGGIGIASVNDYYIITHTLTDGE